MKIKLNSDMEIVKTVKEGLKKTGGYCPCRIEKTDDTKCMCVRSSRRKLPIQILKAFAIVCSTIKKSNVNIQYCKLRNRKAISDNITEL